MQAVLDALDYTNGDHYFEEVSSTGTNGYTNRVFPTTNLMVHHVYYYDNYDFDRDGTDDFQYNASHFTQADPDLDTLIRGKLTGTYTLILGTEDWLKTVNFYDTRGRVVQTQSNNPAHLAVEDISTMSYNFKNELIHSKSTIESPEGTINQEYRYTYDNKGRLITTEHKLDNEAWVILNENTYNELGQVIEKGIGAHGGSPIQQVDYYYNIRGWLTGINNADLDDGEGDLFGMELLYNEQDAGLGNNAYYNGNIGAIKWNSYNPLGDPEVQKVRSYNFSYDAMDRMTAADYKATSENTAYDVSNISYDKNGNLLTLHRNRLDSVGGTIGAMDQLSYAYKGNQLLHVADASNNELGFKDAGIADSAYSYDVSGNLIRDEHKGSTLFYNELNKTDSIAFDDGRYLVYRYDANGIRYQKIVADSTHTDTLMYIGGMVFKDDTLQYISTGEGRVIRENDRYNHEYFLTDHLGNVRVSVTGSEQTYQATMESEYSEEEEFYFGNVAETRFTSSTANTTEGGDEVSLLNNQHPIGPSFVMKVAAGDTVKLSTRVYYESAQDYGTTVIPVNDLITALTGTLNPGALIGESAGTLMTDELSGLSGLAGGNNGDQAVPDAYLNNVLFDQDMNYLGAGFKSVEFAGISSNEHGTISETVVIQEDGYMLAYVSNESNSTDYVHFDDFTITHIKKREVRQINHYYPFGLTMDGAVNQPNTQNPTPNTRLFNAGSELQELSNLYDTYYRQYDASLGRFNAIDPKATSFTSTTPYNFAFNDPVALNDPLGDCPTCWYNFDENGASQQLSTIQRIQYQGDSYFRNRSGLMPMHRNDIRMRDILDAADGVNKDYISLEQYGNTFGSEITSSHAQLLSYVFDAQFSINDNGALVYKLEQTTDWWSGNGEYLGATSKIGFGTINAFNDQFDKQKYLNKIKSMIEENPELYYLRNLASNSEFDIKPGTRSAHTDPINGRRDVATATTMTLYQFHVKQKWDEVSNEYNFNELIITIGHELIHAAHYESGDYAYWFNTFGEINGVPVSHYISEAYAYKWAYEYALKIDNQILYERNKALFEKYYDKIPVNYRF